MTIVNIKVLTLLLATSTLLVVMGQQPGKHTPEVHPKLEWQQCQSAGQCTTVAGGIVLDAGWRWVHNDQDKACFRNDGSMDPTVCPDAETCSKSCQFEGVNYTASGVTTSGNSLHQTLTPGSRLYLLANDSTNYELFYLLDKEFTFDVDTSKVPCGGNGAVYLVSMEHDGGVTKSGGHNKAGAKYGMGYCDAQCAKNMKFVEPGHGACCAEMDIWEANSRATVLTPHPCTPTSAYHLCTGSACQGGTCEQGGCGLNPYGTGRHDFYGPNKTVNTNKVFTVVTQFITNAGSLSEIRRFYVQDGKVIPDSTISQKFCESNQSFNKHGGLQQMGVALKAGMVLAFSLWDDAYGHMQWLDGGNNGPCTNAEGDPKLIEAKNPYVVWSNIKVGPINSTFAHH